MIILLVFAFLAGIVTILSPCILPVLPIILASSIGGKISHSRPYGIIVGFVLSFTFFTLFLSSLVKVLSIPSDSLRTISIFVIATLGLSLLIPRFQLLLERLFSRLANLMPNTSTKAGFGGGLVIGLSLGLLWTPCVGPILASVIALAISGSITSESFLITLAYSMGTAIPMFFIIIGGQKLLTTNQWLLRNTVHIQKVFGVVMMLTAFALYNGFDRSFQSYVLEHYPQYGSGLTKFEDLAFKSTILQKGAKAPSLVSGGEWFNSEPLNLDQLKGKVVIIDFWTYTCINCQRTLPYLKSWYDKYHDQGLVIIGVHSPEFEFEKNPINVQKALDDFGIKYPVMQDNNFDTWRAFNNNYWPAKYFIDKDGLIRYTHFGEGGYDESEARIQALLKETGATISSDISNPEAANYARTKETYLGSKRGGRESYLKFEGNWTTSEEYKTPTKGSKLLLNFDAKNVFLVMRNSGTDAKVKIFVDDLYTKTITINQDTLYSLVDLSIPGPHLLRLEFEDNNAQLFAFTFG